MQFLKEADGHYQSGEHFSIDRPRPPEIRDPVGLDVPPGLGTGEINCFCSGAIVNPAVDHGSSRVFNPSRHVMHSTSATHQMMVE